MKTLQKTSTEKKKYSKKLTAKNQVTIPMYFIKKFNMGKNVSIEEGQNSIVIKKDTDVIENAFGMIQGKEKNPILAFRGIAKGSPKSALELKQEIRKEEKEREKKKFGLSF